MTRMAVTPSQFDLLSKLVDVTQLRQRVLAQNVANVNTPGYRRLEVRFEDALADHVSAKGDSAVKSLRPDVVEDQATPSRLDGNNVEIDLEMMRLNKNTLLGNTYLQLLTTKLGMLKRAINGRTA
jgi:flagellar basal-body rod protein FlgB